MTKDTVAHLNKICDEQHINAESIVIENADKKVQTRFESSKELAFLEKIYSVQVQDTTAAGLMT